MLLESGARAWQARRECAQPESAVHVGRVAAACPAGHLILYPSTSQHRITPVTRGERLSAFFWLQSMIRDDARRRLLFEMDVAIQRLGAENPTHPSVVQLTGVYHNLLRLWGEV